MLFNPNVAFVEIAKQPPSSAGVFFGFALWLGLCPPVFAYVGTMTFGWRLGVEPLFLPAPTMLAISAAYFALPLFGFLSTAFVARWMASIALGRSGVIPASNDRLDAAQIRMLTAWLAAGAVPQYD